MRPLCVVVFSCIPTPNGIVVFVGFSNLASGAVLKRLGFEIERPCKELLRINGKWEDSIQTSLIDLNLREDESSN